MRNNVIFELQTRNDLSNGGIEAALKTHRGALTSTDLSLILTIGLSTVYRYAQRGILPKLPLPGVVRFDPAQVAKKLFGREAK